jgi:hypothetical protein
VDDFDLRLELELAHLLDPVVDGPVPRRRRQPTFRAVAGGLDEQPVDVTIVAESVPVAVAAPVAAPL